MNIISLLYFRCIQKVLYWSRTIWPSMLCPNTLRCTRRQCKKSQVQRCACSNTSNNTDGPDFVMPVVESLYVSIRCWTRFRISLYAVGESHLLLLFLTSCLVISVGVSQYPIPQKREWFAYHLQISYDFTDFSCLPYTTPFGDWRLPDCYISPCREAVHVSADPFHHSLYLF